MQPPSSNSVGSNSVGSNPVVTAPKPQKIGLGGSSTAEDVCDRFYGALMGFAAGCHQSGIAPQALLEGPGVAQPNLPESIGVLWENLPALLLYYGRPDRSKGALSHRLSYLPSSDSFESNLGTLEEVAQVLHVLMEAPTPQSCRQDSCRPAFRQQMLRELLLPPGLNLLRQRLGPHPFQWSVCFDSLITRSPVLATSLVAPTESPAIEGGILGLWIGAAHGIRVIPLAQQIPLWPWKATIQQRAFQTFWQWAGSSQSDKVGVS